VRFDLARYRLDYLGTETLKVGRGGIQYASDLIEIAAYREKSAVRRCQLLKLPLSELW
jgi:hypothetical protein